MREISRSIRLAIIFAAFASIAARPRKPKVVVADPEKARVTAFSGSVGTRGKVDLKVCFGMEPEPKVECVRVDGSSLLPILNGAPLEAWKDANGF